MIARKNRFHGHKSVSRVRGETIHSSLFSCRFEKTKRADYRLAVVVSKKISLKAVVRNRIRRRIFETFRQQRRLQGISLDVIVYVKSADVASIDQTVLDEKIASATKKMLAKISTSH